MVRSVPFVFLWGDQIESRDGYCRLQVACGKHRTPIRNRDFADSTLNIEHPSVRGRAPDRGRRGLFLVLAGMEAELKEFGFHGDAGDSEPTGSASLITLCEFNGAGEDFAFGIFEDTAVDI